MPGRFPCMDCLLSCFAPVIPAKSATLLNYAMTRDKKCNRVVTNGKANGSCGVWVPNCVGHLGVTHHFCWRYL